MATGKRRGKAQVARDRRRIADLYLQGEIQADIAEALEISQATVSRDIKALQGEWLASALVDFNEAKAQELAKIDKLEREYWDAWQRSCEDKEATLVENREAKGDKQSKSWLRREGQAGDPRFLQGVQWCIERRCKILGIDAPEKKEITGAMTIQYTGNVDPDDV
jgi:predicted transcriptional regulator